VDAREGGFDRDGRFATLRDVVDHYDARFRLQSTDAEVRDLVEYLKSLWRSNAGDAPERRRRHRRDADRRRVVLPLART